MISRWAIKRVKDIISGLDQNTDILKFDFEQFDKANDLVNAAVKGDDSAFVNSIELLEEKGLSYQEAYSLMQEACGNSNQPNSKAGRIVNAKHAKETATRIQKKYAKKINS